MPTATLPPLADLLTALEAAVRVGDRAHATQLTQAILQHLASEAAEGTSLERRVRALMAQLDQPMAAPRNRPPTSFILERSKRCVSPQPGCRGWCRLQSLQQRLGFGRLVRG